MSNMTFGVNLIPDATNTRNLGNADKKWNAYLNTINGVDVDELGGGSVETYTFTIPTTGWSQYGNTDLYTKTVSVNGVTASVNGILGIVQTGTESTDADVRDAYSKVTRAVTGANNVTLYALEIPAIAIPAQLVVFE